ncbi:MAG: hypothetical protein AAGU21_15560 [Solidesulfovibrio sp.]
MNTFWVFAHIDGDGIKHYRQFESPAGRGRPSNALAKVPPR